MGLMGTVCIAAGVVRGPLIAHDLVHGYPCSAPTGRRRCAVLPLASAIFGVFAALGRPLMPLFYMRRRERLYATLSIVQVAVTIAAACLCRRERVSLVAVAAALHRRGGDLPYLILCVMATRIAPFCLGDFARVPVAVEVLAALVMAAAVQAIRHAGGACRRFTLRQFWA